MQITRTRQAREQLEALLDRVERIVGTLSFDDSRELARLYRISSAQLAAMRMHAADPDAIRYLNALCVRAYTRLQVAPPHERRLQDFFFAGMPKVLAATAWLQGIVAVVMLTGVIAGAAIVAENPAVASYCVPASFYPAGRLATLIDSPKARADFLERKPMALGFKSFFSAALFVHNMSVGLLAFASGMLAGIPTLIFVFYNGLSLGAFAWIFSRDSLRLVFWAWLLPHAIPELLGVTLCATAGLLLGRAIVAPGRESTSRALKSAAQPALEMVAASVPLLIAAAIIESFLRQSMLSTAARFGAAAIALGAIGSYVRYVWKLSRIPPPPDLRWLVRSTPPREPRDSDSAPARSPARDRDPAPGRRSAGPAPAPPHAP